jgi:hypothetical protein
LIRWWLKDITKKALFMQYCNQHFLITILIFKGYERVNPKHSRSMTTFFFEKKEDNNNSRFRKRKTTTEYL